MLSRGEPGTCRFCGCHGEECRLANGDECSWATPEKDTCNAAACLRELSWHQKQTRIEMDVERKRRKLAIAEMIRFRNRRHKRAGKKTV
jgi:hypothetical protein